MKDALGRVINTGDIITYPVRARSSLWLAVAQVTGQDVNTLVVRKLNTQGVARVAATERVTIAVRGDDLAVGCK